MSNFRFEYLVGQVRGDEQLPLSRIVRSWSLLGSLRSPLLVVLVASLLSTSACSRILPFAGNDSSDLEAYSLLPQSDLPSLDDVKATSKKAKPVKTAKKSRKSIVDQKKQLAGKAVDRAGQRARLKTDALPNDLAASASASKGDDSLVEGVQVASNLTSESLADVFRGSDFDLEKAEVILSSQEASEEDKLALIAELESVLLEQGKLRAGDTPASDEDLMAEVFAALSNSEGLGLEEEVEVAESEALENLEQAAIEKGETLVEEPEVSEDGKEEKDLVKIDKNSEELESSDSEDFVGLAAELVQEINSGDEASETKLLHGASGGAKNSYTGLPTWVNVTLATLLGLTGLALMLISRKSQVAPAEK